MEQLQLIFPTARSTDPQTSHQAGKAIQVRAGSQQWKLLKAYSNHPLLGMTDEEAGIETGLDKLPRCCYWKRCSELRAAGLIEPTGDERFSTAKQKQQVCRITKDGMALLRENGRQA